MDEQELSERAIKLANTMLDNEAAKDELIRQTTEATIRQEERVGVLCEALSELLRKPTTNQVAIAQAKERLIEPGQTAFTLTKAERALLEHRKQEGYHD